MSLLQNLHAAHRLMVEDIDGMDNSYTSHYHGAYRDLHFPAIFIALGFVLVASSLSIFLVFEHLRSYTNPAFGRVLPSTPRPSTPTPDSPLDRVAPSNEFNCIGFEEQKWIVAVIFMVPTYAIESIISLLDARFYLPCDILRSCYEAFALYSFGSYLVACLGGEHRVLQSLEELSGKQLTEPLLGQNEKRASQKRSFLKFFHQPNVLGKNLYTIVKFGLVQYMILKTLCAFLEIVLETCGVYCDGEFKWNCGYPYLAAVLNFSQMWALFCLVQFYHVTKQKLQPIKPLSKFISFKAIVFATWWQGVGIAILCALGVFPKEGKFKTGLQDFLICIEMSIAAVAHMFVFSAKPYRYLPVSEHGKVTTEETKATMKFDDGSKKPAEVEQVETHVEAPGTSVTQSVQDIVLGGGECVVKDIALTINQAVEPVGKGVTKIQETFHHTSVDDENEKHVQVEEHVAQVVEENGSHHMSVDEKEKHGQVEEHVEQEDDESGSHVV